RRVHAVERIRVHAALEAGERLERAAAARDAKTRLDQSAELRAAIRNRAVDAEHLSRAVCEDAETWTHRPTHEDIGIGDPRVVDERMLQDTPDVERAVDG